MYENLHPHESARRSYAKVAYFYLANAHLFTSRHLTFIVFILYKVFQWRIKVEPNLEDIQKSLIELNQNQYLGWDSYLQPLESFELNDLKSVEQRYGKTSQSVSLMRLIVALRSPNLKFASASYSVCCIQLCRSTRFWYAFLGLHAKVRCESKSSPLC